MRFAALFRKTAMENLRDWKILSMTLSFAPFFVVLMYFYFHDSATVDDVQSLGFEGLLSDFDLYVPALLALALMMLLFTAAASLIKEKDKGTLIRLRLSNMTVVEWLSAISAAQILLGLVSMGLALLTAVALGYRTSGSIVAILVVGALTGMAMVAISVMVAAWLRTVFDLMTIGSFPFFVLMFFSGGMFPIPDVRLFSVAGRTLNLNDILPTTHAVSALGQVLNFKAGIGDLTFELAAIAFLTVAYFAMGAWMFTRRHMRAT